MGLRGCLGESLEQYKQRRHAAIPIAVSATQQVENKITLQKWILLPFSINPLQDHHSCYI